MFAALGFEAPATTSSGFAFTLGRPDGGVGLDELLVHVRAVDVATALPVEVDLENGFGRQPADAARAMAGAAETIRDRGDFSGLCSPDRVRAWMAE